MHTNYLKQFEHDFYMYICLSVTFDFQRILGNFTMKEGRIMKNNETLLRQIKDISETLLSAQ